MLAVAAITLPIINNIQFDIYNRHFLGVSVMQKKTVWGHSDTTA